MRGLQRHAYGLKLGKSFDPGTTIFAAPSRPITATLPSGTTGGLGDFNSADAAFAWDEGEDDRSLESWRTEHRRYWQRGCAARGAVWRESDEIVFERFRVVWPPELADV